MWDIVGLVIPFVALVFWAYETRKPTNPPRPSTLPAKATFDPAEDTTQPYHYSRKGDSMANKMLKLRMTDTNGKGDRVDYDNPLFRRDEYWEAREKFDRESEDIYRYKPGDDPQEPFTHQTKPPFSMAYTFRMPSANVDSW